MSAPEAIACRVKATDEIARGPAFGGVAALSRLATATSRRPAAHAAGLRAARRTADLARSRHWPRAAARSNLTAFHREAPSCVSPTVTARPIVPVECP
jgi:hypothetical protein